MKVAIVGNVVLDKNENGKYEGPGGSAYFIAKTLTLLGIASLICSSRGKDFSDSYLSGLAIYPPQPTQEKTIVFENDLINGKRIQHAHNINDSKNSIPSPPPNLSNTVDYLVFCPIIENLTLAQVIEWKRKINPKKTIMLPQGLLRKINADNSVTKYLPDDFTDYINQAEVVVFSDEDIENSDKHARKWSKRGPIVIVTRDKLGCDLYQEGTAKYFSTYQNKNIVDMNGLGDVFAGVLVAALSKGKTIKEAVQLANAGAAISKSYHSINLSFTWDKLEDIVKNKRIK